MTVQEAKDILANDWWKYGRQHQKEILDIVVGSLISEDDDSFIINASLVKKGEQPTKEVFDFDDDCWSGWYVLKENGKCDINIEIAGVI